MKRLDMWGVDMLFVVGGNGGNAGANAIQQKCEEADVLCNVIGVPKSIDNDILLIDKCFGFDTAVEEAQRALLAAKVSIPTLWPHRTRWPFCVLVVHEPGFVNWSSWHMCMAWQSTHCLSVHQWRWPLQGHLIPDIWIPCLLQVEASSARKGIGLVKLMGRQSGFIAMQASMASGEHSTVQ